MSPYYMLGPMDIIGHFRRLSRVQRNCFFAAFLGWSLDALDFFLLVFCIPAIGGEFHAKTSAVAEALFLTLAFRPLGAFLFGAAADKWGRKPALMVNILCYSLIELACAFAPSLSVLLVLRALFGIAMGGEWGVGAALTFETLPAEGRGVFSGLLQEGYAVGYLLAAAAYGALFPWLGWRGLFMLGALPAVVVLLLRMGVEESPVWLAGRQGARKKARLGWGAALKSYTPVFLFVIVLMACFNAFSHGTQDLYPTFLTKDLGMGPKIVGTLGVVAMLGALAGGVVFGALSERWGRKRAIIVAAMLAVPVIPLYAFGHGVWMLGLGAFLMQFMVQGAWGVVPAYLAELSPAPMRATFPGLAYQMGNLICSRNAVLQAKAAERLGKFAPVLAGTVLVVAVALVVVTVFGRESRGAELAS